jgi:sugar phosphate isomerase/epimerase
MKTTGMALAAGVMPVVNGLGVEEKEKWLVGCRDTHLSVAGKADSWSCMKALGAEGTEVQVATDLSCPNLFHPRGKYTLATDDGVKQLKDDLAASGCKISAFLMANRFDEQLEAEIDCTRKLMKVAGQLGVKTIRIDVVPRKLAPDKFLPFAITACKKMCEQSQWPIRYGVENHGQITNNPDFLDRLFDGVGSSSLGFTLDCANFYWWGHPLKDLYGIYERMSTRVVHTHCKSIHYPEDKRNVRREMGWEYDKYNCPIFEGDIDFRRIVKILRAADYCGDLCVEDESLGKYPEGERAGVMTKEIAMLKKLA